MPLHNPAADALESVGRWARFDRYEIVGGHIRPAAGARLEVYDPWATYRPGRAAPYESLLELSERLPFKAANTWDRSERSGELRSLPEQERKTVTSWCAQHGLLGVLLMRVRAVVLAARREEPGDWPAPIAQLLPRTVAPVYVRGVSGWGQTILDEPEERGRVLLDSDYPEHNGGRGAIRVEPLGATKSVWPDYFPSVPWSEVSTFRYPRPGTPGFWRLYAEPVWDFLLAAQTFRRALSALMEPHPEQVPRDVLVARGRSLLERLVGGVRLGLGYDPQYRYRPQLVAPSLLASYAAMALLDVGRGGGVFQCANPGCRVVRPRHSARSRFCGSKCERTTAQQRRRVRQRVDLTRALRRALPHSEAARAARAAVALLRAHGSFTAAFDAINSDAAAVAVVRRHVPRLSRATLRRILKPLADERAAASRPRRPA